MKNILTVAVLAVASISDAYVPIPYRTPSGSPPPRKDIDTMGRQEFDLYILAMQEWQKSAANNVGGYFQVAGIHGAPHTYWDNAGGFGTTSVGDKNSGYCFHNDQNFYLWHRPYLSLFEQQMKAIATNISNNWYQPQRSAYQAAANTLRMPYWDWAKGSTPGTVPASISGQSIQVTNPSTGQLQTIRNPLFSHTVVSGGNLGNGISVGSTSGSRTTYRSSTYTRDMVSRGASLRRDTALLFNTPNVCWNVFVSYDTVGQRACSSRPSVPSLESTHNTVHNSICGTMCNLDVSAFDPIFWLHHTNVDRIGALWQAINPNTRIVNSQSDDYTFVTGPGNKGETFTYLPFRWGQGNTNWWQPRWLYDTRTNAYTYPEIADNPQPSTVLSRVNALYGNGRTQQALTSGSSKLRRGAPGLAARQAAPSTLNIPPSPEALIPFAPLLIARNGSFHEYAVACSIRRSIAPGTSFNVHLFFGNVQTGSDYLTAPNRVGGFSISQSGSSDMSNDVTGIVTITDALLNTLIAGNIKDLKPSTVRKFVRARLTWKIVSATGQDIGGRARGNGLSIKIEHSLVTPPSANVAALPVVAAPEPIADTTDNTNAAPIPAEVRGTASVTPSATGPIVVSTPSTDVPSAAVQATTPTTVTPPGAPGK